MSSPSPEATVKALAMFVFAPHAPAAGLLPVAMLAFILPLMAAPKLTAGMAGWIRHLNYSAKDFKAGLVLGLAASHIPLGISILVLSVTALMHGYVSPAALPRLVLLLVAAVYTALPAHRRFLTVTQALLAAACAFAQQPIAHAAGILLLLSAHMLAGPVREGRKRKPWKKVEVYFEWGIAWRALGWRIAWQYVPALLIVGATALFARNSELTLPLLKAAGRFGGIMATSFYVSSLADKLAHRRPPWPWARSLPVTSCQRVASDALFLGLHAIALLAPVAFINFSSMWFVLMTLPLISIRATGRMRRFREQRIGISEKLLLDVGTFLECFGIAALTALLPWTSVLWIAASIPAFITARNAEARQKVSLWLEMHYMAAGDSLNWSDR
jgi:hypothetical protein